MANDDSRYPNGTLGSALSEFIKVFSREVGRPWFVAAGMLSLVVGVAVSYAYVVWARDPMEQALLVAVSTAFVAVLSATVALTLRKGLPHRAKGIREKAPEPASVKGLLPDGMLPKSRKEAEDRIAELSEELTSLGNVLRPLCLDVAAMPSALKSHVMVEVGERLDAMEQTVRQLQERLPEESTLDRLASVNDAILATRIDALERTLEDVQERLLTKWDVLKVLFAFLGGLAALATVASGAIALVYYFTT